MESKNEKSANSIYPKLIGSSMAGILETSIFHPFDTISKRLMSNEKKLIIRGPESNLKQVIFHTNKPFGMFTQIPSLYRGIGYGIWHRASQRMYGYGGQPILRSYVEKYYDAKTKNDRILCETAAGAVIGVGESMFMPSDVLKVKKQTNIDTFNGRSFITILRNENMREMYRGIGITSIRNLVGRSNLYFINSVMREYVFEKDNQWDMSFMQYSLISFISITSSILFTAPFDVIKTRVQNRDFGNTDGSFKIARRILNEEGYRGFFKGLNTKLLIISPKIMFSFTASQYLISYFEKNL